MSILLKFWLATLGAFAHGTAYPSATPETTNALLATPAPDICPDCMVRLMVPLGNSEIQSSELAQFSLLVDEAAAELGKPHSEIYSELDAVIRARRRPRFDPSTLIDPAYTEEGRRLFDRMVLLLRKFIAAYVTAVAENGESSTGAKAVAATQQSSETPSATATAAKTESSSHSTTSRSSHSKSHSARSEDDDDEEDDDEDDDSD
ncbi:hypothetical protein EV183_000224 [Coemansia sp. RSA 2336]|nr:hypothetical protein EV183_000224 [Coemansia sp. RSA 2336]